MKKEKKPTKKQIKECLWFWFGKCYIRWRDTGSDGRGNCISSGARLHWTEGQAGHYIPNGSCKNHTWNEDNVHMQSYGDNVCKHGNVLWYRDALILKIGELNVLHLELTKYFLKQWKDYELIDKIKEYRKKALDLIPTKDEKTQLHINNYIKKNALKRWEVRY